MLFLPPFYELHHFALRLPKQQVSIIRRSLLLCDNLSPIKYYCVSDVQIQIKNPLLSSKERVIGNIRRIKYSFSNVDFKTFLVNGPSTHASSTSTPVLMRVSVSEKKLNRMRYEDTKDLTMISCAIPRTIEELAAPEQFRKKNEHCEKEQRTKKAANYLRTLANLLKTFYKKNTSPETPSAKSEVKEKEIEVVRHLKELIKHKDQLKERCIMPRAKNSIIGSLTKMIKEEVNREEILHPVSCKKLQKKDNGKETKRQEMKKRNNTTLMSSGLSFAEKMEKLATSRFVH